MGGYSISLIPLMQFMYIICIYSSRYKHTGRTLSVILKNKMYSYDVSDGKDERRKSITITYINIIL